MRYKTSLQYSYFDSSSITYCALAQDDDKTHDLRFWKVPFRTNLWLLLVLLLAVFCTSLQLAIRQNASFFVAMCFSAYTFIAIMVGDGNIRYKEMTLCLAFLGLAVGLLYSNGLLSLVVKAPSPTRYHYLKEILKDGYKLLVFSKHHRNVLVKELEIRGVRNFANTFHDCTNLTWTLEFVAANLPKKKLRIEDTSAAKIQLNIYKTIIKNTNWLRYDFNMLVEVLQQFPYFWAINTLNRYWIRVTINWIQQSGLQTKWNDWEQRAYHLTNSYFQKVTVNRDDRIESRKTLLLLGIVHGMGITLAIVCLLCEKLQNK